MKIKILDNQGNLLCSVEVLQVNSPVLIVLPEHFAPQEAYSQNEPSQGFFVKNYQQVEEISQNFHQALENSLKEILKRHSGYNKQKQDNTKPQADSSQTPKMKLLKNSNIKED